MTPRWRILLRGSADAPPTALSPAIAPLPPDRRMTHHPTPSPAVILDGIAQRFGARWALRGVSLEVAAGEVLAIVGHNGSGKSTLLRVVATALRPSRGTCRVFGLDTVRDSGDVRGIVSLLAHDSGLYGDLTVIENLQFAARMLGQSHADAALVPHLERVGLAHVPRERARALSSGMQRRLAIARLLLRTPKLLLLDEPFNSLDAQGVELVSGLVHETRARGGTVMMVAHDLGRGTVEADRIITMTNGQWSDDTTREPDPSPGASPELVPA
jgi:heme exporter protein A